MNSQEFCERIVDETMRRFHKINILINNAGIYKAGNLLELKLPDYDNIMNTNVRSVIMLTKLCLSVLIENKGVIVNNSSFHGTCSMPGIMAYSISKAALDQFTKCLALELADKQVRVNSVNPGTTQAHLIKIVGPDEIETVRFLLFSI